MNGSLSLIQIQLKIFLTNKGVTMKLANIVNCSTSYYNKNDNIIYTAIFGIPKFRSEPSIITSIQRVDNNIESKFNFLVTNKDEASHVLVILDTDDLQNAKLEKRAKSILEANSNIVDYSFEYSPYCDSDDDIELYTRFIVLLPIDEYNKL